MAWFRQCNSSLLWNFSFKFHVHVLCGCRQNLNDCQLCRFQNGCLVILNNVQLQSTHCPLPPSPMGRGYPSRVDLFVKCAHLHPGYAANLVARSRYYHHTHCPLPPSPILVDHLSTISSLHQNFADTYPSKTFLPSYAYVLKFHQALSDTMYHMIAGKKFTTWVQSGIKCVSHKRNRSRTAILTLR